MKCTRIAFALSLAVTLGACDGGARGSGITTAQGNVESVETALGGSPSGTPKSLIARLGRLLTLEGRAEAQSQVAGIRVLVEGTSVEDETSADGSFSLRGRFEGDSVIRFERPETGASARISVNAPAGGVLTLNDVQIDEPSGQATARSQGVVFDAIVASIDCPGSTVQVISRDRTSSDTDFYALRVDTSNLHDSHGVALSCEALREGDSLRIQGSVNADRTFGNADVELR